MKQKTRNALREIISSPNLRIFLPYEKASDCDLILSFNHGNFGKAWFGGMPTLRAMAEDLGAEIQEGLEVAFLKLDHEDLERGGFYLTLKERN
jgi:hypothetical protein